MIPEGAPGTIYKRPQGRWQGHPQGSSPMDKSYTIPNTVRGLDGAARPAAHPSAQAAAHAEGVGSLETWGGQEEAACVAEAPGAQAAERGFTAGSDMQLTAGAEAGGTQQQEHVALSGRLAFGREAQGAGRVAARRASMPPAPLLNALNAQGLPQQAQVQGGAPQGQRPGSAQLTAESLAQPAGGAGGAAAQVLHHHQQQMQPQFPQVGLLPSTLGRRAQRLNHAPCRHAAICSQARLKSQQRLAELS